MDFNSLVFPIPKLTYNESSYPNQLIWIPRREFTYKDKIKIKKEKKPKRNKVISMHTKASRINKSKVYLNETDEGETHQCKLINDYSSDIHSMTISSSSTIIHKIPTISFQIDNKFVESNKNINREIQYIPCLYLKSKKYSNKIIIYFHSNYEDLGSTYSICECLNEKLNINILSVEFPKYGIYKSNEHCNEDLLIKDAEIIYNFLTEVLEIKENNIILIGRCVGSGPATYLAAKHLVLALILISPFKSIKEAVRTMFPTLHFGSLLKMFVKERFNNYEAMKHIESPILFIHGKQDTIIPYNHSVEMIEKCNSPAKLVSPHLMSHNRFDFEIDIANHIKDFLKVFNVIEEDTNDNSSNDWEDFICMDEDVENHDEIFIPPEFFKCPYN